jgi:hypothetical protein
MASRPRPARRANSWFARPPRSLCGSETIRSNLGGRLPAWSPRAPAPVPMLQPDRRGWGARDLCQGRRSPNPRYSCQLRGLAVRLLRHLDLGGRDALNTLRACGWRLPEVALS